MSIANIIYSDFIVQKINKYCIHFRGKLQMCTTGIIP